jgi:hypothetical protein
MSLRSLVASGQVVPGRPGRRPSTGSTGLRASAPRARWPLSGARRSCARLARAGAVVGLRQRDHMLGCCATGCCSALGLQVYCGIALSPTGATSGHLKETADAVPTACQLFLGQSADHPHCLLRSAHSERHLHCSPWWRSCRSRPCGQSRAAAPSSSMPGMSWRCLCRRWGAVLAGGRVGVTRRGGRRAPSRCHQRWPMWHWHARRSAELLLAQ